MITPKARYRLVYDRKNKADTTGKGLIELQVYIDAVTRRYISTKKWVPKSEWDARQKQVNSKNENYIALNNHFKKMIDEIEAFELDLINQGRHLTIEKLNEHLKADGEELTFTGFWEKMLKADRSIKHESKRPQQRALEFLIEYAGIVRFKDIDYSFVASFDSFLRKKDLASSTVWRIHKDLRKFINLAINYDHFDVAKYPYRKFKITKEPGKQVYLNYSELQEIEKCDVSEVPKMDLIKDIFLFQCYTGLRYSDVHRLSASDFEDRDDGTVLILDRMYKVNRRLFLKLWELFDGKPQAIFSKYQQQHGAQSYIFGRKVSNAEMNLGLKVIQEAARVRKLLTTHVGRHTFGTLYAHKTGSIFDVMKAMGISKFETAQIYIDLSEEL